MKAKTMLELRVGGLSYNASDAVHATWPCSRLPTSTAITISAVRETLPGKVAEMPHR
jgi:hypothetical protein